MNLSELFWKSSLEEIKKGYVFDDEKKIITCLICGKTFEKGIIYSHKEILYEAEKYIHIHINETHGSVFDFLLEMDKKYTGLTDIQKNLLDNFYNRLSDQEILKISNAGSLSTIRNHRFNLREKEKQAKVFLAIMEILNEKVDTNSNLVEIHRTATMVDERYVITEDENKEIIKKYFKDSFDSEISKFPKKEKQKIVVLRHIMKNFSTDISYTEKEVNEILKRNHSDYVTLRRYLIEYGFMERKLDGSEYKVKI
ncbi:MAG: DUF2087 domain-containing protein [Cyanobacteriota bacterium]